MTKLTGRITVLGATGFIGSHLVERLRTRGVECFAPARDADLAGKALGNVIYCIGLTSDFRSRPLETVDAHVCALLKVIEQCDWQSLLYLSSTRLYSSLRKSATEDDIIPASPLEPGNIYNISKLMGEALVLGNGRPGRVARISNVYGDDVSSGNFLSSIIRDALITGKITLLSSPETARDFICIEDVVDGLLAIVGSGRHKVYNLASGAPISNRLLVERISDLTKCEVEYASDVSSLDFPLVSIDRMRGEFGFSPRSLLEDLENVVEFHRKSIAR
jgi:nucleoside-diphosphate-sugar epimerase